MSFQDPTSDQFLADQAREHCRELVKGISTRCEKTGEDPVEILNAITKKFKTETQTVRYQMAGHPEGMAKLLADMDAARE